jgi:alpha-mannosidase
VPGAFVGAVAVVAAGSALDNGVVRVTVGPGGTLALVAGDVRLDGLARIVDGGDIGDSYNYARPPHDDLVDEPEAVELEIVERGPLVARLVVRRRYRWAAGLAADRARPADPSVPVEVVTTVELRAGEPFVRLTTAFVNASRDHRVRLHLPLGGGVERSFAEGQFAVVERGRTVEGGHGEYPDPTAPARGWVAAGRIAALLDHVTEYELVDGAAGTELALTLLRSFDRISRNDNPWRDEPAGPQIHIPDAELLGPWTIRSALFPLAGSWHEAGVVDAAETYQHPFVIARGQHRPELATGPREPGTGTGIAIGGRGVVLSALRRVDDELELRLVVEDPAGGIARVTGPFAAAREVDLLGRDVGELALTTPGVLDLPVGAWDIRTVRLRS